MPEATANLWFTQALSDRHGAGRLHDENDQRTWCQTIAKHQQTVEKSVKAIAAAVSDAGIVAVPAKHYYDHDVDALILALRQLPRSRDKLEIQSKINDLLSEYRRKEIGELSRLAPHRPAPGALHERNTEYPFETTPGDWQAPAQSGVFTAQEVTRFDELAEKILEDTRKILQALRRR